MVNRKINIIIIKTFIKFLKDNNALEPYVHNLLNDDNEMHLLRSHSALFSECSLLDETFPIKSLYLFEYAFDWNETEEGYDYWCDLDNMWYHIWHNIWKKLIDYEKQI